MNLHCTSFCKLSHTGDASANAAMLMILRITTLIPENPWNLVIADEARSRNIELSPLFSSFITYSYF